MARKNLKIKLKPILFIACEGTSSEYQYFESWAQTDEALNFFGRVDVYPDENEDKPKTTPYQLYEKAKRVIEDGSADFAWIVFDKDNHPRLLETFNDAAATGVKIAFSSRSFEEWVLMHFQKINTTFNATECKDATGKPTNCGSPVVPNCAPVNCLTGYIRRHNFIPDYSKKKTFDLFAAINYRTEIAFVNASWLRFQVNASLNTAQPALHPINPYTDVDQLILKLHNKSDIIEWGASGTDIRLNNWILNASIINGNISVKLSHTKPHSVALNALFPLPNFFTTDDDLNDTPCTFISSAFVVSHHGSLNNLLCSDDIIEYTLQSNNQPYFLFKDNGNALRIYFSL
ncbi:RloB family protein [Haliscomenobacter sp.]|uniref:RloB family protein n=1 Tax=Haliscomenobacter sp. TaxID=2717303 RepID=UPI0035945615